MRMLARLATKLILLLAVALPAFAFDGAWREVSPPERYGPAAFVDPSRDRLLLFGGNSPLAAGTDLWGLPLAGAHDWQLQPDPGAPASASANNTAFLDGARGRVLLIRGGSAIGARALGDYTYADLPLSGATPDGLAGTAFVYDPLRDRVLCFGGATQCPHHICPNNNLWEIPLQGTRAFAPLAATGTAPAPRTFATAVYDPVRDRVLFYSGYDDSRAGFTDLWALDLAGSPRWEQLAVNGAPPPSSAFAAYDPVDDAILALTAYSSQPPFGLWRLSLSGAATWAQIAVSGASPAPRYGTAVAFDASRHRLLLHGGLVDGGETWELTLGASAHWNELDTPPPGRTDYSTVYDPREHQTLLFGGFSLSVYVETEFNDVWARRHGVNDDWQRLQPTGTPPLGRYGHAAVYDGAGRRMIVFGGYGQTQRFADVWSLALDPSPAWSPIAPAGTPPSVRIGSMAIYDPAGSRLVMFGGDNGFAPDTAYNDTWSLSLSGAPAWSQLTPAGPPPSPRHAGKALYDSRRHRMLVLGGYGVANNADQLWALSLDGAPAWTPLVATNDPGHVLWEAAYYDSASDRILALGPDATATDVWALSLAGPLQWTQLATYGGRPSGRPGEQAFFDPAGRRLFTFGGRPVDFGPTSIYPTDAWAFTWLDAITPVAGPAAPASLSIRIASPNPSPGDWLVAFSLPSAAPAQLALLDLAGRRLATRDVGAFGAGRHELRFRSETALPAGLYFIRLSQGDAAGSARAILVH